MSSQAQVVSLEPGSPATGSTLVQAPSLLHRLLMFPIKFLWGMFFCQGLAGSILVVGWTYRLAQRGVFKCWFTRSARPQTRESFIEFLAADQTTRDQAHWPNWFARQNFRDELRRQTEAVWWRQMLRFLGDLVQSLWVNLWRGLRGIINTWALTLPAGIFWWFGWYDGWNNSFNKGYEQAAVGPLVSVLGIAWFIAAMFYVPLAQARQAVTGEWRSFYQFRLIWAIVRDRWLECVGLALLYTALSLPLSVLKTSPMFWMHQSPALGSLTSSQVLASLKSYYFWCALWVLPAVVVAHLAAARMYAAGLISLVQTGKIAETELAPAEHRVLDRLGLLTLRPQAQRHLFVRFIAWTSTRLGRAIGTFLLILIWFSFVAQIYISQFLNYHSGLGWMNQQLVQLPWFRYFPSSAHNAAGDLFSAMLVVLIACLIASIIRGFQGRKGAEAAETGQ